MISYEEKEQIAITLDHLSCLKRMYDAGIDISGIWFGASYPFEPDFNFFFQLLDRFFPSIKIINEGDDPTLFFPFNELYLSGPEELKHISHDTLDELEKKYFDKFDALEDELTWAIREWVPVQDFGFIYDHHGDCIAIYMKFVESSTGFDPEIKVLLEFYQEIKNQAREHDQ